MRSKHDVGMNIPTNLLVAIKSRRTSILESDESGLTIVDEFGLLRSRESLRVS